MKKRNWKIYDGAEYVDTVQFDADMWADDVRRSLIDHDGYSPTISVHTDEPRVPSETLMELFR